MNRLTEPCGPNHFRICGNKTVYNRKPPKSSRVSYALAKLFQMEEQDNPVKADCPGYDELYTEFFRCPICGHENIISGSNYCPDCGQRVTTG